MEYKDYYAVLNVPKNASPEEVKKAYRKLARKLHPDVNQNDKDAQHKFQELNEANEVLSDPEKRKKYDEHGKDWKHAEAFEKAKQSQQHGSTQQHFGQEPFDEEYSDFFSSLFGGAGRAGKQVKFRGQDLTAALHLKLEDALQTAQQLLTVNNKKIRITIPAGIENGQTIKISGHGSPGINGGPNGDLYITFSIAHHPVFKRLGNDLHKTVELELYTAILGGEIVAETMGGKVKLKVQPGTQNGMKVKLKGKGFPIYKREGEFGDLYINYHIKIPTELTDQQKELFLQLSKS